MIANSQLVGIALYSNLEYPRRVSFTSIPYYHDFIKSVIDNNYRSEDAIELIAVPDKEMLSEFQECDWYESRLHSSSKFIKRKNKFERAIKRNWTKIKIIYKINQSLSKSTELVVSFNPIVVKHIIFAWINKRSLLSIIIIDYWSNLVQNSSCFRCNNFKCFMCVYLVLVYDIIMLLELFLSPCNYINKI